MITPLSVAITGSSVRVQKNTRASTGAAMRGKRSGAVRRRRLQARLCVSVETLLRLRLRLPPKDLGLCLPVRPATTVKVLRLLALGALDLDFDLDETLLEEEETDQIEIDRLSAVSPNESDHGELQ